MKNLKLQELKYNFDWWFCNIRKINMTFKKFINKNISSLSKIDNTILDKMVMILANVKIKMVDCF